MANGKLTGFCSNEVPTIAELVDHDDDELFKKVLSNPYHVLRNILPNEIFSTYALRRRRHQCDLR